MSTIQSGASSPFSVCSSPEVDLELTEQPVPTTILDTDETALTEPKLEQDDVIFGHAADHGDDEHIHHDHAHGITDDEHDGFGPGSMFPHEDTHSIHSLLHTPDPGWTDSQKLELATEIGNAVFRYERNIVRGTLPWETVLMAQLFKRPRNSLFIDAPLASVPMPFNSNTEIAVSRTIPIPATVGFALRRVRNARLLPSDDALRVRAMIKWRLILELDLEASHLGRTVKSLAESLINEDKLMQTIHDSLASKSTATLFKRAQSIMHYYQWSQSARIQRPLLFNDVDIYGYVCYLRENSFSPTKAEAFKQAVNFVVNTFGMSQSTSAFSNRFLGACRLQYLNKRPLHQAPPLTVIQVKKLERVAVTSPSLEDRVIAGQFLFCLYASCRFSDSMYIKEVAISQATNTSGGKVVLIDAGTLKHKTATTRERATTFLPLLATGVGVENVDWANPWFQARENLGLSNKSDPFLPAFLLNGKLSDRRMTTGEASAILKDMLSDVTSEGDPLPTTHSLKATVLSWLSKDGAPLELRRIAGHHMDPSSRSVLTYSRDALLSVMVRVNKILKKIRDGSFEPDAPRAQFLLQAAEGQSEETEAKANTSSESDEDVAEVPDALNEAPQLWNQLHPDNKPPALLNYPLEEMVQHSISGVVHFVQVDLEVQLQFLRCGRPLTDRFAKLVNKDPIEWPLCKVCEANWKASLDQ